MWGFGHSPVISWLEFFCFGLCSFWWVLEKAWWKCVFCHLSGREPSPFTVEEASIHKGWVTCPLMRDRNGITTQVSQLSKLLANCFCSSFPYKNDNKTLSNESVTKQWNSLIWDGFQLSSLPHDESLNKSKVHQFQSWNRIKPFRTWTLLPPVNKWNSLCLHLFWGLIVQLNPPNVLHIKICLCGNTCTHIIY